jgi:hypothetical protein
LIRDHLDLLSFRSNQSIPDQLFSVIIIVVDR